jgi:hypothetical protein
VKRGAIGIIAWSERMVSGGLATCAGGASGIIMSMFLGTISGGRRLRLSQSGELNIPNGS